MQVVEITSLSGHSPFNISICDITLTYCYVVATGVVSVPPTLELQIPAQLDGANQVLVVVTDAIGCQEFILQTCPVTPTPTPTITPTPTPTRIIICNCISFQNTTAGTLKFEFTQCDGKIFNGAVESGTTLYYCGRLPSAEAGVNIIINDECINNTCPDSVLTPTPTPTPTQTPTPTITPTICLPQTIYSGEQFSNLPVTNGTSFKSDGTILYVTLHNQSPNDGVCAYSLSTPWDVSTITLPRIGCSIASPVSPSGNYGTYFSPDGTKLFLANATAGSVLRYTLSTPWNVSTSSYSTGDLYTTSSSPGWVEFSTDGYYMFVSLSNSTIKRYTLLTPWVINTGVSESQSISSPATYAIRFQNNGYYLFSLQTLTGQLKITKRTLSIPYDLTSIVSTENSGNFYSFIPNTNFYSLNFKDGYKGFIGIYTPTAPSSIYAFNLTCEYDISGAIILPTPTPTPTPTQTPTPTTP